MTLQILVDADACPVKDEIYRVATRLRVPVTIVSNSAIRIPPDPLFDRVVVGAAFDAADDWIAERAAAGSVVVTGDILLADRCLKAGATVLAPTGKPFTTSSIGMPSRCARSWPICAPAERGWAARSAVRPRSRAPIARASCRHSTPRWSC